MKEFDLKKTDPELVDIFNTFAFGKAFKESGLDERTGAMCALAANLGMNALGNYKSAVTYAMKLGLKPLEIREITYQSVPLIGFDRASAFVREMDEVFEEQGIALPLEGASTVTPEDAYEKGLSFMTENFGPYIKSMASDSKTDSYDFNQWLIGYTFGEFYTRGVLDGKTRELLTFVMLYTMDDAGKQVKTHIRINLRIGNDKELLLGVLKALTPFVGFPKTFRGLNYVNSVVKEEEKFQ